MGTCTSSLPGGSDGVSFTGIILAEKPSPAAPVSSQGSLGQSDSLDQALLLGMAEASEFIFACSEFGRHAIDTDSTQAPPLQVETASPSSSEDIILKRLAALKDVALEKRMRRKFPEAASAMLQYVHVARRGQSLPETSMLTARFMHALGEVHYSRERYDEALECFTVSLRLHNELECNPDEFVVLVLQSVAVTKACMGVFEGEEEKAMTIIMDTLGYGKGDPRIADAYDCKGTVELMKMNATKARQCFERALTIKLSSLGKACGTVARSHRYLARVLIQQGDLPGAIAQYCKALEVMCATTDLGEEHPDTGACYLETANLCCQGEDEEQEHQKQALEYYSKALYIFNKLLGPNHVEVRDIYGRIASTLQGLKNHEQGAFYWAKALSISPDVDVTNECERKEALEQAGMRAALGRCRVKLEFTKDALDAFDKSIATYTTLMECGLLRDPYLENAIVVVSDAATTSVNSGAKWTKSLEYFCVKERLIKLAFGEDHADVAALNDAMGTMIAEGIKRTGGGPKDMRIANQHFQIAFERYGELLPAHISAMGPSHPEVAITYETVRRLGAILGKQTPPLESYSYSSVEEDNVKRAKNLALFAPPPKAGWVRKRGHIFKTMRQRFITVREGKVVYRADESGIVKGQIDSLCGYRVELNEKSIPPSILLVGARDLFFEVTTLQEAKAWRETLSKHIEYALNLATLL